MKFKVLLGLFIIALFLYALSISPFTSNLFSTSFFSKIKAPSGMFEFLKFGKGNYFEISADFSQFSQISSFEIENSSFNLDGICLGTLEVNGAIFQEPSYACKINGFAKSGEIEVSKSSMTLNLEESNLKINERSIRNANVRIYVIPFSFNFQNGKADSLKVKKCHGKVEKLINGKVDLVKMIYGSDLIFENFEGSLQKLNSTLSLKGITTKVKGSDFEW